jgi:hypothetical protein
MLTRAYLKGHNQTSSTWALHATSMFFAPWQLFLDIIGVLATTVTAIIVSSLHLSLISGIMVYANTYNRFWWKRQVAAFNFFDSKE